MRQIRLFSGCFIIYCIFLCLNIFPTSVSVAENTNTHLNKSVPEFESVPLVPVAAQDTIESLSSSPRNDEPDKGRVTESQNVNIFSTEEKKESDVIGIVSENSDAFEIINNDTPIITSHISVLEEKSSLLVDEAILHNNDYNTSSSNSAEENINVNNTVPDASWGKNVSIDNNAEEIPSFSEWTQKHLDEIEKKEQINYTDPNQIINSTKHTSNAKLRWKNYASVDCGAKVILANPDGKNSWAVLSPSTDEYKLDACNNRIWFIVELCEAIQLKKIDMANYELFSSSPKEFVVYVSDRFPTRDWSTVGNFMAKDERDIQGFDINTNTFGKYIKVEIKSHYGSEHYCPISLFRAYGISVFEVLQKDDPANEQPIEDDDDDDNESISQVKSDSSGNLLSSATDAVLSMVKKAAEVLGNKVTNESSHLDINNNTTIEIHYLNKKSCICPSHSILCRNCSYSMFDSIFELLSCNGKAIESLLMNPIISSILEGSHICAFYGISFKNTTECSKMELILRKIFTDNYIGALCNNLAIIHNKLALNVSYNYKNNSKDLDSGNLEDITQKSGNTQYPELVHSELDSSLDGKIVNELPTEPLNFYQQSTIISKATCSTETIEINPSKSMGMDAAKQHVDVSTVPTHLIEESVGNIGNSVIGTISTDNTNNLPSVTTSLPETSAEQDVDVAGTVESNGDENIDKMISEDLSSESNPVITSATVPTSNLQGQKESVFLRLSNRIKALERNMSLSGQYLEELSKRYKKQVEEMQRILESVENTLKVMTKQVEQKNKQLEDKIEFLTGLIEERSAGTSSFELTAYFLLFIAFIVTLIYFLKKSSLLTTSKILLDSNLRSNELVQRCHSVDSFVSVEAARNNKKKRRPSDQALNTATSAQVYGDPEKQSARKRKKSRHSAHSITTTNLQNYNTKIRCNSLKKSLSADWVESQKVIDDIPIPLEEADSSTLEQLPITSSDVVDINEISCIFKTAASMRSNRNSFNNSNKKLENSNKSSQSSLVLSATESISTDNSPKKEKGLKRFLKKVILK